MKKKTIDCLLGRSRDHQATWSFSTYGSYSLNIHNKYSSFLFLDTKDLWRKRHNIIQCASIQVCLRRLLRSLISHPLTHSFGEISVIWLSNIILNPNFFFYCFLFVWLMNKNEGPSRGVNSSYIETPLTIEFIILRTFICRIVGCPQCFCFWCIWNPWLNNNIHLFLI